jgi:hypothetical protein
MLRILLIIGVVLSFSASGAAAQRLSMEQACSADIKAKCGGVEPGDNRVRTCIKENIKSLSAPCRARLTKLSLIWDVCKSSIEKVCEGVKPGGDWLRACVRRNLAELSEPCKDAMIRIPTGLPCNPSAHFCASL